MFTGLVQDVGRIAAISRENQGATLTIETTLAERLAPGDSLAVNGVCLTVTPAGSGKVQATAIAETLARTTLGALRGGSRVNLEPALAAGAPLGGHLVQGHVDGVARVEAIETRGDSREITFALGSPGETGTAALARYVAEKGSVALDGVSLTVARLPRNEALTVALVPHTLGHTTFGELQVGQRVNVEVDIVAKYVERLLSFAAGEGGGDGGRGGGGGGGLSEALLRRHGFM
ncbi:MAG: riboflavin synthase [Myxococcales bacterium]|nr:riboflavin synthase [Myxococcales bacterium]